MIAARLREEYPTSNTRVDVWIDPLMRRALGGMTGTLVTPGYFEAMGIDILKGRNFDLGEMTIDPELTSNFSPGMNGIVIVNQAFVDRYWSESETEPPGQVIRALITILSASIFGIQAVQVLYLVLALLILAGLMFLSTALPALKATRVDPVDALRVE